MLRIAVAADTTTARMPRPVARQHRAGRTRSCGRLRARSRTTARANPAIAVPHAAIVCHTNNADAAIARGTAWTAATTRPAAPVTTLRIPWATRPHQRGDRAGDGQDPVRNPLHDRSRESGDRRTGRGNRLPDERNGGRNPAAHGVDGGHDQRRGAGDHIPDPESDGPHQRGDRADQPDTLTARSSRRRPPPPRCARNTTRGRDRPRPTAAVTARTSRRSRTDDPVRNPLDDRSRKSGDRRTTPRQSCARRTQWRPKSRGPRRGRRPPPAPPRRSPPPDTEPDTEYDTPDTEDDGPHQRGNRAGDEHDRVHDRARDRVHDCPRERGHREARRPDRVPDPHHDGQDSPAHGAHARDHQPARRR